MTEQRVRIVAGLGNPGDRYRLTRHNIGFMVADRLIERMGCDAGQPKFSGLAHDCRSDWGRVIILKPLTFMNRSGRSASAAMRWFKTDLEDLLVIYDDLDLPFGEIRIRPKGSPAGHNGLSSIIEHLGSQEVPRLRVGIGRPPHGDTISYVLSRFRPEEEADLPVVLNHASNAVLHLLEHGIHDAMGRYNGVNILAVEDE
jgi:peptidyl-tRNA hydrolase, PTH1 family